VSSKLCQRPKGASWAIITRGKGSGIKVDGTAGDGLTISTYIKDAGNSTGKAPPGPIYHQRAQSNEFWLRAATRTSFFTIRGL
jgi:hypothetical protein